MKSPNVHPVRLYALRTSTTGNFPAPRRGMNTLVASRYTRSRRPVELAAVISVADRLAALREEARIKRLPRAAKLRLIATTQPHMPKAS